MPKDDRPIHSAPLVPERASGEMPRISGLHPAQGAAVREELDLSREQQMRIAALFAQLETIDLYDLLGVAHDADKKEIKRAYNALVLDFHPDRFFRKRLGSFKPKMEAIVARMTEAVEILSSPERRAEYDSGPKSDPRHGEIDALLAAELAGMPEGDGRYETFHSNSTVPIPTGPASRKPSAPAMAATTVAIHRPPVAVELEERRRTLARKLSIRPIPPKKP